MTNNRKPKGERAAHVWAVCDSGYEHHTVLKVFACRESAEKFLSRIQDYEARKPRLPDTTESPKWENEWAKFERWQKRHPAGLFYADILGIEEYEVHP